MLQFLKTFIPYLLTLFFVNKSNQKVALADKADDKTSANPEEMANARALHAALVSRHSFCNQLLWQVPIIALTAQAFLLTIAFDNQKYIVYRCVSGMFSTGIGILSWHLFVRHAIFEKWVSIKLAGLERKYFGRTYYGEISFAKLSANRKFGELKTKRWRPAKRSARNIWASALFSSSFAGIIAVVLGCLSQFWPLENSVSDKDFAATAKESHIDYKLTKLSSEEMKFARKETIFAQEKAALLGHEKTIANRENSVSNRETQTGEKEVLLKAMETAIKEREAILAKKEASLLKNSAH